MFHIIGIAALVYTIIQIVKEELQPRIPAENWANMDLYHEDMMRGVPIEQRLKYVEEGRYKLTKTDSESYRTPDDKNSD